MHADRDKRYSKSVVSRRQFCAAVATGSVIAASARMANAAAITPPAVKQADYQWLNVAMGGGGAIPGIILHPRVPGLAYIHTDVGGCYRLNPRSMRWTPLLDRIPFTEWNLYGVDSIAIDPNDHTGNIVYISTGQYTSRWAYPAGIIMKSVDRGATWIRTSLTPTGGSNQSQDCGERLAVDPANSRHVVYASQLNGLFTSFDAASTWKAVHSAPRGWTPDAPAQSERGHGLAFVVFDPSSGRLENPRRSRVMYLGATGEGVYRSDDGGDHWQLLHASPRWPHKGVIGLNGTFLVSHRKGVAKYSGGKWHDITPHAGHRHAGCAVAIDPRDPDHIVATVGGGNVSPVFRSTDGGITWRNVSGKRRYTVTWWAGWQWFSHPFSLAFDPHQKNVVWGTDWYGTYRTENIHSPVPVWTNHVTGIEELCIIGALAAPAAGRCRLFSGAADEGGADHVSLTRPPRRSLWVKGLPAGLDRTGIAVDPQDPNFVVCVGTTNWNLPGTGAYTFNGGKSWKVFPKLPYEGIMGGRVVIAGNRRILWVPQVGAPYHSDDLGRHWNIVKCRENLDGCAVGNNIFIYDQPVAVDLHNPNQVYLLKGPRLFLSVDAGESFTCVCTSLPDDGDHKIFTSGRPNDVWVSCGKHGLLRSRNAGRTFSHVANIQVADLFCFGKAPPHRSFPALFVQGRVQGIDGYFRSDDEGRTWLRLDMPDQRVGDAPNTMTGDWRVFGGVFVGTTGRGIFYGRPKTMG